MIRMRRLRVNEAMRSLVRENSVSKNDLVYPVFLIEGENIKNPVDSIPGCGTFCPILWWPQNLSDGSGKWKRSNPGV